MTKIEFTNAPTERYTIVANEVARDPLLTLKARGLLVTLLSLPPGTRVSTRSLIDAANKRDTITSALNELREQGYLMGGYATGEALTVLAGKPAQNQNEGGGKSSQKSTGFPATSSCVEDNKDQGAKAPVKTDEIRTLANQVVKWSYDTIHAKAGKPPAWSFIGVVKIVDDLLRRQAATPKELALAITSMGNTVTLNMLGIQLDKQRAAGPGTKSLEDRMRETYGDEGHSDER